MYEVYEAEVNDKFNFVGFPLLKTDDLARAACMAHDLSTDIAGRRYVVWQPSIQSLRANCCSTDKE